MQQRTTRDYEVSLWTLQDSLIAILKQYGLEYKGQIQNGKLTDRDDGTQTFSFSIPMYIFKNGTKIQNPSWYNVKSGNLLVNMRKIKVIFNMDSEDKNNIKVYEFLITKIDERHQRGELYCQVQCEGLAFHELGKIGYKISLSADDFYQDDYDYSTKGVWTDSYGKEQTYQPLATLNYWNDKVFSTIDTWTYQINMNWDSFSLEGYEKEGNTLNADIVDDLIVAYRKRSATKVYEDDFVDSWKNDEKTGKLVPAHITSAREKARVSIDIQESNIYNITQKLAEIFGVFCKYVYEYDQNYHIINRKVIYYNNFLNEKSGITDVTFPYQTASIKRTVDGTDLVTKLFVKSVENTASNAGITSIIDTGANSSGQDYILNFDYLHDIGSITDEQYLFIDKYKQEMREINEKIKPLSSKVISLQSQLVNIEAELTTRSNAITLDTEQIFSNKEFLNNLTHSSDILSLTASNPQTAVLLRDTGTSYESYYIKITQKGVYPESIHLYRSYSYSTAKLADEITTGQVIFDEYGNVIRINNIYADETMSKTVYIIYDYKPSLFYERIEAMWESRLSEDTAQKDQLEKQRNKINFILYGEKSQYPFSDLSFSTIPESNIYYKYLNLINEKNNLIKELQIVMGPALREGYWQPEDYADYGDKYADSLKIGEEMVGEEQAYKGSTGMAQFLWDSELFQGEQQLYYEYSAAQKKYAYPCINLEKHPEILTLLQNNLNKNINFYYNPIPSIEAMPYARERPKIYYAPITLYLVRNLYTNIGDNPQINPLALANYSQEILNKYNGIIVQKWLENTYKRGYSTFYWQGLPPGESEWVKLTNFSINDALQYGDDNKYTTFVEPGLEYSEYVRLTGSVLYPQELQLFETDNFSFQGWQLRLIVRNNKGTNLIDE